MSVQTHHAHVTITKNLLSWFLCIIYRLFSQIASHKVDFSKVALYVVSDYVTTTQQVTLVPAVKVSHHLYRSKRSSLFERNIVNIFLSITPKLCFGCSKEPSH